MPFFTKCGFFLVGLFLNSMGWASTPCAEQGEVLWFRCQLAHPVAWMTLCGHPEKERFHYRVLALKKGTLLVDLKLPYHNSVSLDEGIGLPQGGMIYSLHTPKMTQTARFKNRGGVRLYSQKNQQQTDWYCLAKTVQDHTFSPEVNH